MTTESPTLGLVDRGLFALFGHHADDRRTRLRDRYRAADPDTGFEVYVARLYGLSWLALVLSGAGSAVVLATLPAAVSDGLLGVTTRSLPVLEGISLPSIPRLLAVIAVSSVLGVFVRWTVFLIGNRYLVWTAKARRTDIAETLPGAVRYLRVLASGTHGQQAMLRAVAEQDAYGETAVAFRRVLNRSTLTGSLDEGIERVASETPSRELLAPFLLKFREHANQSTEALEGYLEMEGRLLSHQQSRQHERIAGYLELLAELFVVLLVVPALVVLIVTVMSVLAPGLSAPVQTPLGAYTVRTLVVYGSAAFVLTTGLLAAYVVVSLRPANTAAPRYARPTGLIATLSTVGSNPASTVLVMLPVALLVGAGLWMMEYRPLNAIVLSYVTLGLPTGVVTIRRARRDDAKDREIQDFVHAIAGHVALGRPFPAAVQQVARDIDLGALTEDVDTLAFSLSLGDSPSDTAADRRAAALEQFVDRVGTPLAEQTIGLVVGALDAGSDAEDVFETLQSEIGRLYDRRKKLRSALLVYVAVGWTTALLVLGITVAVNVYVLEEFAQIAAISEGSSIAFDPSAIRPQRERYRFYLVTQATMLSCGIFAGTASRGRYEALLHSSALVLIGYAVFSGVGLL